MTAQGQAHSSATYLALGRLKVVTTCVAFSWMPLNPGGPMGVCGWNGEVGWAGGGKLGIRLAKGLPAVNGFSPSI